MKNLRLRRRRRKTKDENEDERRNGVDRKRTEEGRNIFQNKTNVRACGRYCRGVSLTLQYGGPSRRAVRQRSTTMSLQRERVINYRKCPNFDAERTNERTNERTKNAGDFQFLLNDKNVLFLTKMKEFRTKLHQNR
jgi:hypothetical protein